MSLDTQLRDVLEGHLDSLVPPPVDLAGVERAGRRIRRRRRTLTSVVGALTAVSVVGMGLQLSGRDDAAPDHAYDPLGPMDFSHGLQAYADPGHELHIGGRTVAAEDLPFLDTDAVATAYGVAFYRDGDLLMVQEDGTTATLDRGDSGPRSFHPTVKTDADSRQVAYAVVRDGVLALKVMDLADQAVVASHDLECSGSCDGLVIDGIDRGTVFVRTGSGTVAWDVSGSDLVPFAGPDTRVADVRNGVVLYDGPAPDGPAAVGWTLVAGAVDAQLTLDGRYVLYWSSRLQPTDPSDSPITLRQGPVEGLGFWAIDTDGTVLVAAPKVTKGTVDGYTVFDCEVPSGACAELGPLDPRGGDPMFIGSDM